MLEAWLSFGYIVLLAILVLAFILWRTGTPVLAIAALVVGISPSSSGSVISTPSSDCADRVRRSVIGSPQRILRRRTEA